MNELVGMRLFPSASCEQEKSPTELVVYLRFSRLRAFLFLSRPTLILARELHEKIYMRLSYRLQRLTG